MQRLEYDACLWDEEVYCKGHLPPEVDPELDAQPILEEEKWESIPTCCVCGSKHPYVQLKGIDYD